MKKSFMETESDRAVYFAIGGNVIIAIAKFVAAFFSGSSAMISEGIHSLVDTCDGFLLLLGRKRSSRPPDLGHDFGFGMELYFWTLIVAILIFALGGGMSIYEGLTHLRHPQPLGDVRISYIVLFISFISEGTSLWVSWKQFLKEKKYPGIWQSIHRGKDPTIFTVVFEDTAAILGLTLALLALILEQWTHLQWIDGAASILIGLILSGVAFLLTRESKDLLVGESVRLPVKKTIQEMLLKNENIQSLLDFRSVHFGPHAVLLTVRLQLKPGFDRNRWSELLEKLKSEIQKSFPAIHYIFFEPEF